MSFGNGCVISLYKPTTTLQPKVLGFVWCTLSHCLFPKAMDNQPKKHSIDIAYSSLTTNLKYTVQLIIANSLCCDLTPCHIPRMSSAINIMSDPM